MCVSRFMSKNPPFCPITLRFAAAVARRRSERATLLLDKDEALPDAIQALESLARDLEATAERIAMNRPGEVFEEHI